MATMTVPGVALPTAGDDMLSAQVREWITNLRSIVEDGVLDENNVDLTGTDGIMGKSTAQTLTGLKSFESTSVAAGGIREVMQLGLDPTSGTAADADGGRIVLYTDDDAGTEIDLVHMDWVLEDASAATNVGRLDIYTEGISASSTDTIAKNVAIGGANILFDVTNPATLHTASANSYTFQVRSTGAQTIPSGTTTYAGSVNIDEPNLTATGTITNAFTLRVSGAPSEGANNYAFWVDAGATKLDGTLTVGGAVSLDGGAFTFNDSSADLDARFEGANNANLILLDAGQDALSFGGANVDGTAFALNNLTSRTHTTSVGSQFHVPAQTTNFDNASGTIAIGSGAFFGIPTWTNANSTLTMTNAATVYIQGAPVDSTNVTATNTAKALWVDAGLTALDGAVTMGSTITGAGVLSIDDTTESTSTTTGSIHTDGGLGVVGDIYAGDDVFFSSGAVLNFNSADMTITHSSDTLTVAGGTWATSALTVTEGIMQMKNSLDANVTIAANYNGMSVGKVSVAASKKVIVPSSSRWAII